MIAIEFDRAKMRRFLTKSLALFFAVTLIVSWIGGPLFFNAATHGSREWLILLLMSLIVGQVMVIMDYAAIVGRDLTKRLPAVVVSRMGITDNASQFAFGQLTWDQIEKMYPYEMKRHLITDRWKKMPVIFRQRGVAIQLKNDATLSNAWYRSGKRRWLFIPEMVLPITANTLMEQINKFYVTEVRAG